MTRLENVSILSVESKHTNDEYRQRKGLVNTIVYLLQKKNDWINFNLNHNTEQFFFFISLF